MDIETVSVDVSQAVVQEQAPVQAKAMSLDKEREKAATVDSPNSSVQTITDPNLGQYINILE
jgi:hypothetical protein